MELAFRRAGEEEWEHVATLARAAESRIYQGPSTEEKARTYLRESCAFLILSDGAVVGFISSKEQGEETEINEFIVAERFRGKGIGQEAFRFMLQRLAGRSVFLITHPENPALRLYQRFGFEVVGRKEDYYGDGEPRLILRPRRA